MKKLSQFDFDNAPPLIQEIAINNTAGRPTHEAILNKAIKEYPKYFPEEVAFNEVWESIPEETKMKYMRTLSQFEKKQLTTFASKVKKLFSVSIEKPEELQSLTDAQKKIYNSLLKSHSLKVETKKQKLFNEFYLSYFQAAEEAKNSTTDKK